MKWENNYFQVFGKEKVLKIIPKRRGSVVIATDTKKYLLIKIKRADNNFYWEFPRGFSEKKESYLQTAIRELREETGLNNITNPQQIGVLMPDSGLINVKIGIIYIIVDFKQPIHLQREEKIIDFKLVNCIELEEMIKDRKIIDSFTVASYLKMILT